MAGQSPTVLPVAAERGEAWNTHGPSGAPVDDILKITRTQNAGLDELCSATGRDPAGLRRSLLCFGPLDPWTSPVPPGAEARGVAGIFEDLVGRFVTAGISEFVLCWPPRDRLEAFEHIAREEIPGLRAR